ncbi:hypothetical protein I6B53_07525 [Schaalia sp. 19OD2882]|uniref:hypothetical protein n=1 Tax=Schaalia sp. 19OD2882 TaxID=2794089 RepID=UPI001C1F172F|nr:hypothetical protein [Schaalia sp. 19OD2882]QWW18983.1 hypothetical protein I6B53_07525 [Schaalia sp. 19OD2882]
MTGVQVSRSGPPPMAVANVPMVIRTRQMAAQTVETKTRAKAQAWRPSTRRRWAP